MTWAMATWAVLGKKNFKLPILTILLKWGFALRSIIPGQQSVLLPVVL